MTQVGLWREIRQDVRDLGISSNRLGKINNVWWIFPQGNGPRGAYSTITDIKANLRSRDLIVIGGVLRDQCQFPLDVYDLTIVGAANRPRQATSGGVPTGGGATWMAPTSPTALTPLAEVRAQGYEFSNISFTPHTSSAAIRLTRSASVDTIDAGHAIIRQCLFSGQGGSGQIGIEDNGGSGFVLVEDCRFQLLTGTALLGLNTAAAVPRDWHIRNNRFNGNTNAIAMSLTESLIEWNKIRQTANDANNKVNLVAVAGQGSNNQVLRNLFSDVAANVTIAKGYKPGTGDVWRNWVTDVAADIVTVPA